MASSTVSLTKEASLSVTVKLAWTLRTTTNQTFGHTRLKLYSDQLQLKLDEKGKERKSGILQKN